VTRGRPPKGTNSSSETLADFPAASPEADAGGVDGEGSPADAPSGGLGDATVTLTADSGDSTPPPTSALGEIQEGEQFRLIGWLGMWGSMLPTSRRSSAN